MSAGISSSLSLVATLLCFFTISVLSEAALVSPDSNPGGGLNICKDCGKYERIHYTGKEPEGMICGVIGEGEIVNNTVTSPSEFPWLVQLKYINAHFCDGTLLTRRHVITAGLCVVLRLNDYPNIRIHLADNSINRVKKIMLHEQYGSDNNIALIELETPVDVNGGVKTICVPNTDKTDYSGVIATTFGWSNEELKEVTVSVMTKEKCWEAGYKNVLTDNMICASYYAGEKDSCQAGSGGPLQTETESGSTNIAKLLGIVSWGESCANPTTPGLYTLVPNYIRNGWIASHLQGECVCPQSLS